MSADDTSVMPCRSVSASDTQTLRSPFSITTTSSGPRLGRSIRAVTRSPSEMGATVQEIEIPELDEMRVAQALTILAEMAANMALHEAHWDELSPSTRVNLTLGRVSTAADYLQAQRVRTRAIGHFRRAFADCDLILSPTTAVTAPVVPDNCEADGWSDLNTVTELMRFAMPGNLTGLPAIAFPVGYDPRGLPTSMQAMARPWEEHLLLRVAYAAELVVARRRPPTFYDLLKR